MFYTAGLKDVAATFFYLLIAIVMHQIIQEYLFAVPLLWEGYPHVHMTFIFKFFFIVQIAYWLHVYPELYFQRVKREDMWPRVQYASLYLAFIVGAYVMSFTRVALCLLLLQYASLY